MYVDNLDIIEFDPAIESLSNVLGPGTTTADQLNGWQTSSKSSHLKPDGQPSVNGGSTGADAIIDLSVLDMSFVSDDPGHTFLYDKWSNYSNLEYGKQNGMELLMSAEMGQMSHPPGEDVSQSMDDFSSTWNADIYSDDNETSLPMTAPWLSSSNTVGQNMNTLPGAQIGLSHMSMPGTSLTQNRDEQSFQTPFFQTPSLQQAKTGSALTPLKGYAATKTAYPSQPSFANKIKKSQGTASEQSKVTRRKKEKGPYLDDHLRKQTRDTRTTHACIRCRAQKMRVSTACPAVLFG